MLGGDVRCVAISRKIMASGNLVAHLIDAVNAEVDGLVQSTAMQQWMGSQRLRAGDLVIFNNSFLYREGIAARSKNAKYLCIRLDQNARLSSVPSIAQANRVNSRFKL